MISFFYHKLLFYQTVITKEDDLCICANDNNFLETSFLGIDVTSRRGRNTTRGSTSDDIVDLLNRSLISMIVGYRARIAFSQY